MRRLFPTALCVLSCLGGAVSNMMARPSQIVFLGDSLTAGYGVLPAQAFPALLQDKITKAGLPWEVVNAGWSGDTTGDGLRRVAGVITPGTEILVIALGANDGLRQIPPARMGVNLEAIIARARENSPNVRIVLAGMHMPAEWVGNAYATAYDAAFAEVARSRKTIFLPYLLDRVGGIPALNQPDKLHPTAAGQAIIAETIWKVLQPLLKSGGAGL